MPNTLGASRKSWTRLGFPINPKSKHDFKSSSVFPKAAANGSFEKSTVIKDCFSGGCLQRVSSKTAVVMAVFKECRQAQGSHLWI